MTHANIVIVTNGNYFARIIVDDLFRQRAADIKGVLIVSGDYKARVGLKALWEIGRRTSLPYLIYKVLTVFVFKITQMLRKNSFYSVNAMASAYGVPVKFVVAVNSDEALKWVNKHSPDLLVSVSCPQMIRRRMLSLSKLGGINIHSSLLPAYAGLAPYFWVLSNGEKETGTTVHYMTLKFDEGNILIQKRLDVLPRESAFHLFVRLANLGSIALVEAVEKALAAEPGIRQDMTCYSYYSNPDFSSYIKLRKREHCLVRLLEILTAIRAEVLYDNHEKPK